MDTPSAEWQYEMCGKHAAKEVRTGSLGMIVEEVRMTAGSLTVRERVPNKVRMGLHSRVKYV